MPLLYTSSSDYTAFVRASAQLPTNGKVVKTTNVLPATNIANKLLAIASKSALKSAPSTSVVVAPTKATTSNKNTIK